MRLFDAGRLPTVGALEMNVLVGVVTVMTRRTERIETMMQRRECLWKMESVLLKRELL